MQRSPAWVIPRDERKYNALDKALFKKVPGARLLHRYRLYWSNESRVLPIFNPGLAKALSNLAKAFIKFTVKDKETARKLTPDYVLGCKRILISNKYYPMFNRKNVELVTEGIQEIKENSIVTSDGQERPVDCIILGTGFVVDPRVYMKDFPVVGMGGRTIQEDWKDYAESYYGVSTAGYPNMWQLVGPNAGLGHNSIIFMIEAQVHYILESMKLLKKKNASYMDVKSEVQTEFNDALQKKIGKSVWATGCSSWYQDGGGRNFAVWPKSTWQFWLETVRVKAADYDFVKAKRESGAGKKAKTAA